MGLFGGKKKTYSGVGSAVQNLLADKLDNNLNTLTVSAQQNNTDLGEAFKKFLADGSGLKLRSVIDYAHQKGYTKTIGWDVSDITGEVFSDSTAYITYLSQYVYPNQLSTDITPEVVVKDFNQTENTYILGSDVITEKTYTRTKKKTITSVSTGYLFQTNWYYQGSNNTMYSISKFLSDPIYENIPDDVRDSVQYFTNVEYLQRYGGNDNYPRCNWINGNLSLLYFTSKTAIPVTEEGILVCSTSTILDIPSYWYYFEGSQDGDMRYGSVKCTTREYTSYPYWESGIGSAWGIFEKYYVFSLGKICMQYPYSTLNLADTSKVHLCKVYFLKEVTSEKADLSDSTDTCYNTTYTWLNGYALVVPTTTNNNSKVLASNVTVTKSIEKQVSTVTTSYYITEKWVNGELVRFDEVEGAIDSSYGEKQELENSTFTHTDNYILGSGNSNLDTIINNTRLFTEQFMPVMPIKTWGNMCSSAWGDLYTAERKLYKKITSKTLGKWDEFVDSFKDVGDDAKMVYYFPAVPINVDHEFANEYLFHFFKWLAINFGGSYIGCNIGFRLAATEQIDFRLNYNFNLQYRMVKGETPIPCKIHNYARYQVIANGESDDEVNMSWSGGFKSRNWREYHKYDTVKTTEYLIGERENYPNLTDEQYEQLKNQGTSTYTVSYASSTSSITFYYKVNDNLYEKVYVSQLVFNHFVRNTALSYFLKNSLQKNWRKAIDEEATNEKDAGFSPIIIPIARGALESMGWYRQSNLLQVCHNVIVAGYDQKTIKTKWYQSGLFSVIVIVVAVVITVCSWGSSSPVTAPMAAGAAGSAGGAAAAGIGVGAMTTTLTMAAIADMAIQAIACCLIAKAISYVANKYIGGILGTVVSIVGTVVASYYVTGYYRQNLAFSGTAEATSMTETLWDSLCSWDGFMNITKITMDNVFNYANGGLQQSYSDFQNYYSSVVADQDTKSQQMKVWALQQNSWGNDNLTGILVDSTYSYTSTYKDTLQFTMPEDPDAFQTRIRGEVDIWDTTIAYTENFFDLLEAGSQPYPLNLY